MAKITIEQSGSITKCTTEYFAEGQSAEEEKSDYKKLCDSLWGCIKGNCGGCIFCNYDVHNEYGTCDTNLMRIAVLRIEKLCIEKFRGTEE